MGLALRFTVLNDDGDHIKSSQSFYTTSANNEKPHGQSDVPVFLFSSPPSSVADLLVSLMVMPIVAVTRWRREWLLGESFCDFQAILNHMCMFASLFSLAAVAVNRYVSVLCVCVCVCVCCLWVYYKLRIFASIFPSNSLYLLPLSMSLQTFFLHIESIFIMVITML